MKRKNLLIFIALGLFFIESTYGFSKEEFIRINELLERWDVNEGEKEIGKIPLNTPEAFYLRGKLEFLKGNYDLSVEFLKKAGLEQDDVFLKLVENTANYTANFTSHESEHFIIRYLRGKDEILIPYLLDTLEKIYLAGGKDFGYYPEEKVILEIYPDLRSFTSVTPLKEEAIKTTGTVAICQYNRILLSSPRLYLQGYSWLDTLSHEYIHYILTKRSANNAPLWFQEGVAKFFETRWRSEKGGSLTPWNQGLLRSALQSGDIVTFEEMGNSFANLRSALRAALAFAEVETMVGFIVNTYGLDALRSMISEFSSGEKTENVITKVLNLKMDEFMLRWKEYTSALVADAPEHVDVVHPVVKEGNAEKNMEFVKNKKARDYMILGEILTERGYLKAALQEYRKANNLTPDSPYITNKLASLLIRRGEIAEAKSLLQRTSRVYPDYYQTYINLARISMNENDYTNLENVLLSANAINPFDPFIHEQLYLLYRKLGRDDKAGIEKRAIEILRKESK